MGIAYLCSICIAKTDSLSQCLKLSREVAWIISKASNLDSHNVIGTKSNLGKTSVSTNFTDTRARLTGNPFPGRLLATSNKSQKWELRTQRRRVLR